MLSSLVSILRVATFEVPINTGTTAGGLEPTPFPDLGVFITTIFQFFLIITALGAFIYLALGGFQYITSGGDKVAAQTARDKITYAVLGLSIVAAAAAIFSVLGAVFGINIFGTIKWPGP